MLKQLSTMSIDRRRFLQGSAAAVAVSALAATPWSAFAQSPTQDLEILNYALTLEHVEAKAYAVINASGLLSGNAQKYFQQFGAHESTHESALTDTINKLGGKPVAAQDKYNFPALKSQTEVLTFFQMVEEVGASAYLGQAPRILNADILNAAVSIHNVEAQHAAVLSDLIGVSPSPVVGMPRTMAEVLVIVGPLLGATAPTAMPATGGGPGPDVLSLELLLGGLGALGAGLLLRRRSAASKDITK